MKLYLKLLVINFTIVSCCALIQSEEINPENAQTLHTVSKTKAESEDVVKFKAGLQKVSEGYYPEFIKNMQTKEAFWQLLDAQTMLTYGDATKAINAFFSPHNKQFYLKNYIVIWLWEYAVSHADSLPKHRH